MFENFGRCSRQPGTKNDGDVIEFIAEDQAALDTSRENTAKI